MWSDPIADVLTRIRNAVRNRSKEVRLRRSKQALNICQVLKDEGYIRGFDVIDDAVQGIIRVELKYGPKGEPLMTELKRRSKSGRRLYVGVEGLPRVQNGMGISIVSTNRGVISDRQCRKLNIGGELICTVY
jgi:small subunit ribosomal protein S8